VAKYSWQSALAVGGITVIASWAQSPTAQPPRLSFEVASIKRAQPGERGIIRPLPGGQSYIATNVPVKLIMKLMYYLTDSQISGEPGWFDSEGYDIEAKAESPSSLDQLHQMFQTLLADRFKLRFHHELREENAYVLTVDKAGSKLKVNDSPQNFEIPIQGKTFGKFSGIRVPMTYLTWFLAERVHRPVVDKTGLDKNYDFTLEFTPPDLPPGVLLNGAPPPDLPSLFTALHEQLGLKLTGEKAPVEVFVIDHAERPSEN
jgi:uncharacterized protein (TIGR03435 family)